MHRIEVLNDIEEHEAACHQEDGFGQAGTKSRQLY
jgi:hypothetical protein